VGVGVAGPRLAGAGGLSENRRLMTSAGEPNGKRPAGHRLFAAVAVILLLAGCTGGSGPRATSGTSGTSSSGAPGTPPVSMPAATRPNVLIIVTDDQRFDTLGVMPKTRALFLQHGALFPNAVDTTPLCCPSRSTIMTGRYPHNTGVHGNGDATKLDQATTLQRYLHDAGYQTGMVGKFLNSWPLDVAPADFDHYAVTNHGYLDTQWSIDGRQQTVSEYSTSFIGERAVEDLRAFARDASKPWYLYVAPTAPHDPWVPEPRYASSPVPPFVRDPAMRERDLSDKPAWVADPHHTFEHPSVAIITANRASQLRTLRSVDDMVARLFGELGRLGESNDTLALFLSDNGFLWGEHDLSGNSLESESSSIGVSGKRYPYLPSVRIPLAVRWPGHLPEGAREPGFAATVDLAPTILQAAGVAAPTDPPMDGRSLLLPDDHLGPGPSSAYLEYFRDPLYPTIPSWSSIVSSRFQYVRWFGRDENTIGLEYYDRTRDPYELDNLLADPSTANDPDTGALDARIDHDRTCAGTAGPRGCT